MNKSFYLASILIFFNCQKETKKPLVKDLTKQEAISWIHMDLEKDSVPGISLELAYKEMDIEGNGEPVVVAVMDMPLAIHHEDIKEQIYTNTKEIANNGKDDDSNGYIDDIHGWNFLGYGKYNFQERASYVWVRIINEHKKKFEGKTIDQVSPSDTLLFKKYLLAKKKQEKLASSEERYLGYAKESQNQHREFLKVFATRIKGNIEYTESFLDSLPTFSDKEKELVAQIKQNIEWGYTFDYTFKEDGNILIEQYITNNLNYNERENIGDSPFDYETNSYGNSNVEATTDLWHATQVSGLIAATRNNGVGIRGVSNKIKLMPVVVEPKSGHYNDKDLANAIRYAVDNGARIVNFSGNKDITENPAVLFSALKYAENNGVLVIMAAGNEGVNIDLPENKMFFSDTFEGNSVSNLIKVGATNKKHDSTMMASFSNYGKKNVDLFAPGDEIRTTDSKRLRYVQQSGTSLANALTSGVAALIWSQYPELTHQEVKKILMESGTSMGELKVIIPDGSKIQFSELSKSGKLLNAYSALKMASELSSN